MLLTPAGVEAQRRGVTLTGAVEETVALSIAPNSIHSDVDLDVMRTGSSVRIIERNWEELTIEQTLILKWSIDREVFSFLSPGDGNLINCYNCG